MEKVLCLEEKTHPILSNKHRGQPVLMMIFLKPIFSWFLELKSSLRADETTQLV